MTPTDASRSAAGSRHYVHQLGDLGALLRLVAAGDSVLDAMRDVVAQDLLLNLPESGAHGGNLRDDVDAIAILLDHARKAADLPLDSV